MEYVTKSLEKQARDREDLEMYKRIDRDSYFDNLQLVNKLDGVDTVEKVNEADRKLSYARFFELKLKPCDGNFDMAHLKQIHSFLFQDIYYFAGQYRDVGMKIDSATVFSPARLIDKFMNGFFDKIKSEDYLKGLNKDKFCSKVADKLTEINQIHPFREGNGRSKRIFFSQLAENAGYKLDWDACDKDEWKAADKEAFDSIGENNGDADTTHLKRLLNRAITPINDKNSGNEDLSKATLEAAAKRASEVAKSKSESVEKDDVAAATGTTAAKPTSGSAAAPAEEAAPTKRLTYEELVELTMVQCSKKLNELVMKEEAQKRAQEKNQSQQVGQTQQSWQVRSAKKPEIRGK